jgi:BASS family bile acid:Na+ symporter
VHRHFLWLLLGSYAAAALWPAPGLWVRGISFGEIHQFGETTSVTLPMLMLALLLANAGLGVQTTELKRPLRGVAVLLVGLVANLAVPMLCILGLGQVLRLWHDPLEAQDIILGLALVAAMPIAGSSTAWSQIVNGDPTLSLRLVLASTLLSPLTTPGVFYSVGFLAADETTDQLHTLAAGGVGSFLIFCVVAPSVVGMLGRVFLGAARIDRARHSLKLFNACNLLVLNYVNAALSLPQALLEPDPDFLLLTLVVVVGLCVSAFATGWLISWLLRVNRGGRAALVFGLGMNNNGTGLVLASLALADQPRVMLPLILYNLVQHLAAGGMALWFGQGDAEPPKEKYT